jgi:FO synthase
MIRAASPRPARAAAPATCAIVPVKLLSEAKQRLAPTLSPDGRRRLVLAMLRDVLSALANVAAIGRVLVVTPDDEVAALARSCGASVVPESPPGELNAAVVLGVVEAARLGCDRVLVVPGDLPFAKASDFARLLAAAAAPRTVAIAPAADGEGTNGLVLTPPDIMKAAFGHGSFARHLAHARALGCSPRILELDGLRHDIDRMADLSRLAGLAGYAFLSSDVPRRRTDFPVALAAESEVGVRLEREQALALADCHDLARLSSLAEAACIAAHGTTVSFSKKVFIPLTQLCRDVCHYCTFAHAPSAGGPAYLSREQVLEIARRGAAAGCKEALFTLGDKPELRYAAARSALAVLGHDSTLSYLEECARLVHEETGLLPHLNPGVMEQGWIERLKSVSVSQGLMLESASSRLLRRGEAHFGSPDKDPIQRLATIEAAGRVKVPFTTGLLIGIGETRRERVEALLAIRDSHERHGHIQEVIIQNFRAKPGTRMASAPEPSLEEHVWTVAVARLVLGPSMNIQAPPNLRPAELAQLVKAGINDWGGISPVTPDHVNPEAPWPHLEELTQATAQAGRALVERLAIYPGYAWQPGKWLAGRFRRPVLRAIDSDGLAREDGWAPGDAGFAPPREVVALLRDGKARPSARITRILAAAAAGDEPDEEDIVALFAARGDDFSAVCRVADGLRRMAVGDTASYVVTRNINYTNKCSYGCRFCAFSKGRLSEDHRDKPYDLELEEIARRTREAWGRGASEVCLQGGIGPRYTGHTYLAILGAVKSAAPGIHVHAFSPLEVWHGATTLGLDLRDYLGRLKAAGLSSLPGTAAEILDDEVRRVLCPDKITTAQWLEVMQAAHDVGLRSTATIMFGHVERPINWARHLLRLRALQARTGGFTELVPLPFVHMEAPIYLKGEARRGPTFREAILMHAVARLALHPLFVNIQASWVKMGPEGAALCLEAGANDLGGTLMNESITRAAGAAFGQEMTPSELEGLILSAGRKPRQRTTFYGTPPDERLAAAMADCAVRRKSLAAAE